MLDGDPAMSQTLAVDYRTFDLDAADRAMLDYAVEVTRDPGGMGERHVQVLRDHGFSDTAIHDICQVAAYFNFVNRMADGLGVEIEGYWTEETLSISQEVFDAAGRGHLGRGE